MSLFPCRQWRQTLSDKQGLQWLYSNGDKEEETKEKKQHGMKVLETQVV